MADSVAWITFGGSNFPRIFEPYMAVLTLLVEQIDSIEMTISRNDKVLGILAMVEYVLLSFWDSVSSE